MRAISMEVAMRSVLDGIDQPRRLALLAAFGSRSITANAGFRREMGKLESVLLEEVLRDEGDEYLDAAA
jgi:hypothetical protein